MPKRKTFKPLISFFDFLRRIARWLFHYSAGMYYGYSPCCVKFFCNEDKYHWDQLPEINNQRDVQQIIKNGKSDSVGYVLCDKCYDKHVNEK